MKALADEELHHQLTLVLATQFIACTIQVLEQYGLFTKEQNRDIAKDLVFGICAILDGSAFPGRINGEEIAPFVGFYLNHEMDMPLVPENGSEMHAFVEERIDQRYTESS